MCDWVLVRFERGVVVAMTTSSTYHRPSKPLSDNSKMTTFKKRERHSLHRSQIFGYLFGVTVCASQIGA
jgi:hypothetical protein